MTSNLLFLRGVVSRLADPEGSRAIQETYLVEAQKRFCLYALALTTLAVFVSMGFQTQAAAMLGFGVVGHRNWALLPQMVFSIWVVQKLPIENYVKWLAITGAILFVTLGLNPHGDHLYLFVVSTIIGSFQTSLTWKLCARSFPVSMQGQGAQNLCCLGATAIAGTLALSLHGFNLYVVCSALVVVLSLVLVRPFGYILEMQKAFLRTPVCAAQTKCVDQSASLRNIWKFQKGMRYPSMRLLWTLGITMLYPVSMSVKGQADSYTLRVARHLGDGYASVEAGASVIACLVFTLRPDLYVGLAKRVGAEGRLMAGAGITAALTFIFSGLLLGPALSADNLGAVAVVYTLRAVAGVCFEIFERGSEVLSDDLAQGRQNEFAASMLVMVLYRPAQLFAGLPMLLNFSPAACFVASGCFLLIATLLLVKKGKLIGRAFINYAGPMKS
jgi:hypothetical protein